MHGLVRLDFLVGSAFSIEFALHMADLQLPCSSRENDGQKARRWDNTSSDIRCSHVSESVCIRRMKA